MPARRRQTAAPTIPELRPCPDCGVALQRGRGPHGLAFHGCEPRSDEELDADAVERLILRRIADDVKSKLLAPAEAAEALRAIRGATSSPSRGARSTTSDGASLSEAFESWVNRGPVEP